MKVYTAMCEDAAIDNYTHRIEFNRSEREILIDHGLYKYTYKGCALDEWLSQVTNNAVWNRYIEGSTILKIKIEPSIFDEFIVELKLKWL